MQRKCKINGCAGKATTYGRYCPTHKARTRRHGDPVQRGVTKAELSPYLAVVRSRMAERPSLNVWQIADQRWSMWAAQAEKIGTKTIFRHVRLAAHEIAGLRDNVEPRAVVETVLAMYLMLEMEPRRFRSDTAFRTQLVRRVRGLSPANAKEWMDPATGRNKRAYSELPPKVTEVMAGWLVELLGQAGVYLARMERATQSDEQKRSAEFAAALAEVADHE